MKVAALLLCVLAAAAAAAVNDEKLTQKQQDLLQLFVNLQQVGYSQRQTEIGNAFDIYNKDFFTNFFAVNQFWTTYKSGMLPRGEVFTLYHPIHLTQAIQLFDIFYFAKDYDTFYKAACWARDRVNEGQFAYALSVAIVKRADTQGVALPPHSEIYPYIYVNTRAVQTAQNYMQQGFKQGTVYSNVTGYVFYKQQFGDYAYETDYTYQPYQYQTTQEGKLAYFREDIYFNQQFVYQQIYFPSWFSSQKYGQKTQYQYGERFFYYLYQILARYNLERYAQSLPAVTPFQFGKNIEIGYNPQLQYHDGKAVPARPANMDLSAANGFFMKRLRNLDRRFADAIDSRYVINSNGGKQALTEDMGVEILGNMIQANEFSFNNYYYAMYNGVFGYLDMFRKVVGGIVDPYFQYMPTAPGALENHATAMRDPVFYQFVARVVDYFRMFKSYLQPYKPEQVKYEGVQIKGFTCDKLFTYFDNSEVDMYNAISYKQGEQADMYKYKAYQQQLNYKPFTFKVQVASQQSTDAIVRVFIGPKYDFQGKPYSLEEASKYFVEFDRFVYTLKTGDNVMERSSEQAAWFVPHQPNTRTLFTMAQQGNLYYNQTVQSQLLYTMPQNLLLPKGSEAGKEYLFAVTVHQYQPTRDRAMPYYQPFDSRPLGFPFDRPINSFFFQEATNIYFQTLPIFHMDKYSNNV